MKRIIIVLGIFLVFIGSVNSQTTTAPEDSTFILGESELYPLRIDVIKIQSHAQGYRVIYRRGETSSGEVYIPGTWFVAGGKASLIKSRGPQYPYMIVYYKADGSFSHLKLYALSNLKDSSWGILAGDPGDKFKVDTIKLQL